MEGIKFKTIRKIYFRLLRHPEIDGPLEIIE